MDIALGIEENVSDPFGNGIAAAIPAIASPGSA
jgi:hypothetical protein